MPQYKRQHIKLNARTEELPYTSNVPGRSKFVPRPIADRNNHGETIKTKFLESLYEFQEIYKSEYVYLEFVSPVGFILDLEKLDKSGFKLKSYKKNSIEVENETTFFYEAAIYLDKKSISTFLRKIEEYLNPYKDSKINYNDDGSVKSGGSPKNNQLIANIETIRAATLETFWNEPNLNFPQEDQELWWEVWLSREVNDGEDTLENNVIPKLNEASVEISERRLIFPENYVVLVKGSVQQLAASLLYTDRLAELRRPKETADFFLGLELEDQNFFIDDLLNRTSSRLNDANTTVSLIDTGVTLNNPLLANVVLEENLDSVHPDWTNADNYGHGTSMAGLILYGELTELLASNLPVNIIYNFESIKLIDGIKGPAHDPELYGKVTQEAIARGIILNPNLNRVICLATTADDNNNYGRPTSWSSAIDQDLYVLSKVNGLNILLLVSSGNVPLNSRINFPYGNAYRFRIQDPSQSFNAITVGSYTAKDTIDFVQHPEANVLAAVGEMSPSNTTSVDWDSEWCRKPDIVMEGGNDAIQAGGILDLESLQLLTTNKGGLNKPWLTTINGTSAATALASKFAATLYSFYPEYWPETIRALMIHSAEWTPQMLQNRQLNEIQQSEYRTLLTTVGYGVPNLEKAQYTANNALTIVAERILTPFKLEENKVKTNNFHLFDLPWPSEVLQNLGNTTVKLKITLSYYIEPNPGSRQYEQAASYKSLGLRFKIIDSNEGVEAFKARVSKNMRDSEYAAEGGEHWIIGPNNRDKGSIHKDIWIGTSADLATRNKIAVHPVGGWWKFRKILAKHDEQVRYSLVVSIETENSELDILTPILNVLEV